jgi:hypothetical protein
MEDSCGSPQKISMQGIFFYYIRLHKAPTSGANPWQNLGEYRQLSI